MDNMDIKKRIREIRASLGYTQDDMARALKISLNSYRQLEAGKTLLISRRLEEIVHILNTSVNELISGTEVKAENKKELSEITKMYEEKISQMESDYKISIIELQAEVNRLKMDIESKQSIIGLLKENLNNYRK
jgi:transcriptional regulator with XRE-family HTH domain